MPSLEAMKKEIKTKEANIDVLEGDTRSVTRCHHVAFSGSSAPQGMFEPYAARVLYL